MLLLTLVQQLNSETTRQMANVNPAAYNTASTLLSTHTPDSDIDMNIVFEIKLDYRKFVNEE